MDLVASYDTDEDNDSSASSQGTPPDEQHARQSEEGAVESVSALDRESADSDEDASSSASSVDSATMRALEAGNRLRLFTAANEDTAMSNASLPSALAAFSKVSEVPEFLDPEATRQLAKTDHGVGGDASTAQGDPSTSQGHRQRPGTDFDISRLAPPLKGHVRGDGERRGPAGSVIEGKAKRYKMSTDGPEAKQEYTAAQIAMMGGNLPTKGRSTASMPVDEFLDKGHGSAALPRKNQDRKEREKSKRSLGQSSHSTWKSEAEMVLRQQYD